MELNFVEAGIGAGKSTLLRNLEKHGGFHCVQEPVHEWINDYTVHYDTTTTTSTITTTDTPTEASTSNRKNILHLFYEDKRRYAFTFQMMVLMNRYRHIKSTIDYVITMVLERRRQALLLVNGDDTAKQQPPPDEPIQVFIERSIDTDINCFALNCKESGYLNEIEWKIYCDWTVWFKAQIQVLFENSFIKRIRYVFIETPAQVCYDRMRRRNRPEESLVPLKYLAEIEDRHAQWRSRLQSSPYPVHKMEYHSINGDATPEEILDSTLKLLASC